jgi:squalene-hopene/tetraprenyl-beta-curcumene cyclase
VLDALLRVPGETYRLPSDKLERALRFICAHTNAEGALGMMDPGLPDYPNYATALAVSAVCRAKRAGWEKDIQPMVAYLRRMQFTEQNGWKPADPPYGAWGMGGMEHPPPNPGHVDLSMTRYVLQALRSAGTPPGDPVFERAAVFVERCQNYDPHNLKESDGGFFFSTTESDTNKAGPDGQYAGQHAGQRFRSYGTTTADGIMALFAIGRTIDDRRVRMAHNWLSAHHRDMAVPGFVGEAFERWPKGLAFYYAAASTEAFRAVGAMMDPAVANMLKRTQRRDGSWANPENLVKEDDPLIATAFAVRALANQ